MLLNCLEIMLHNLVFYEHKTDSPEKFKKGIKNLLICFLNVYFSIIVKEMSGILMHS